MGVYINENRSLLLPKEEAILQETDDLNKSEPEEEMVLMVKLLERPDLLSFIDRALYERSPDQGFIIGEVESKHILNFKCKTKPQHVIDFLSSEVDTAKIIRRKLELTAEKLNSTIEIEEIQSNWCYVS